MDNENDQPMPADLLKTKPRWQSGPTFFDGLSEGEKKRRLGYVPGLGEFTLDQREEISKANLKFKANQDGVASHAPWVDWRNINGRCFISPVKNQGSCGSCVAFGIALTIDATVRITIDTAIGDPGSNVVADISEAQLFFCSGDPTESCDIGLSLGYALQYCQQSGVAPEAWFPYVPVDQQCNVLPNWQNVRTTASSTVLHNVDDMKAWLSTTGPLITLFTVYTDFDNYTGGVYEHHSGASRGGHCVSVIGFDDHQQAWLCRNSWGTVWGIAGDFWIGYGQCGIDAAMTGITGVSFYSPGNFPPNTPLTAYAYGGVSNLCAVNSQGIVYGNSGFGAWTEIGTQPPPFAARNPFSPGISVAALVWNDQIFLAGVGQDSHVYITTYNNGWGAWTPVGKAMFNWTLPIMGAIWQGVPAFYVTGPDGFVYSSTYDNGWSDWTKIGNQTYQVPAPFTSLVLNNVLQLFGVANYNPGAVSSLTLDNSQADWVPVGTACPDFDQGTPLSAFLWNGDASMFGVGNDGRAYGVGWVNGWGNWDTIGTKSPYFSAATPLAGIVLNNIPYVFGVATDNMVYGVSYTAGVGWGDWTIIGTERPVFPTNTLLTVLDNGDAPVIFGLGPDGFAYGSVWNQGWGDWIKI